MPHDLPRHIAIIMDGNGRWALRRQLPRVAGHRAGMEAVRRTVDGCCALGVDVLTLYAFSAENWHRPKAEVDTLMALLAEFIEREAQRLVDDGIRLKILGRRSELPPLLQAGLQQIEARTAHNRRLLLNLALSYGARQEIVDAVRAIARRIADGACDADAVDERLISDHLYTAGLPDPDLLIRTSGELRLSNFLLWQTSYSEFYVTPTLWPDFSQDDLQQAIEAYQGRDRRFGKTSEAVAPEPGPAVRPDAPASSTGPARSNGSAQLGDAVHHGTRGR